MPALDDVAAPPLPPVEVPAPWLAELVLLADVLSEPAVSPGEPSSPVPQEIGNDVAAMKTQKFKEGRLDMEDRECTTALEEEVIEEQEFGVRGAGRAPAAFR